MGFALTIIMKNYITRVIWILSLVSMFADIASEMLYPVMPIYLKNIGFSILLIGILEGVAEATAGLSKGYFGKLSDTIGKRVPFVRLGYIFSSVSKPLMAVYTFPIWIFFARTLDRLGKGVRTGARDALLSDEATPETKGKVFGFHRSFDTLGAVIGPFLALVYLYFYPEQYKTLFFLAFIPGIFAIGLTYLLKEKQVLNENPKTVSSVNFFSFLNYWKDSPPAYRQLVTGLLTFTLFNSSDMFLLLKAKQSGLSDTVTIELYILYNISFALLAFPVGIVADKLGLKKIFIAGLVLFALVYFGMAYADSLVEYAGLFILYGIYSSATEGISKAWISNISDKKDTATAIGTFSGLQSIFTMLASSLAGFIWFQFGAPAAFIASAVVTGLVILYFVFFITEKKVVKR